MRRFLSARFPDVQAAMGLLAIMVFVMWLSSNLPSWFAGLLIGLALYGVIRLAGSKNEFGREPKPYTHREGKMSERG
jgi:predicted cobalt transporter CbtA